MVKLGRKIVKFRIPIFILSLLLLIPAGIGYINTRVNYDVLYYLPDDIETMKGQDILVDEFGTGAYSMFVCEGLSLIHIFCQADTGDIVCETHIQNPVKAAGKITGAHAAKLCHVPGF